MMKVADLSESYTVRKLVSHDISMIFCLCRKNPRCRRKKQTRISIILAILMPRSAW